MPHAYVGTCSIAESKTGKAFTQRGYVLEKERKMVNENVNK